MKQFKKVILIFSIVIIAVILTVLFTFDRIVIYAVSELYKINVSYQGLQKKSWSEFEISELYVTDRRTGLGIFSKHAKIAPVWRHGFKYIVIDFDLNDVRFTRDKTDRPAEYNNISELVAAPFSSRWTYKKISGNVSFIENGIAVNNLTADSDIICLSFNGVVFNDKNIKADVVVRFSPKLTSNIPDELSKIVLRDEKDGWKSLSVALDGNYMSPAIQIKGSLFRLTIGELKGS